MKTLCVDIGGTAVKYAFIEQEMIVDEGYFTTPLSLNELLNKIQSLYENDKNAVDGLAFSINGKCDHEKGIIVGGSSNEYLNGIHFADLVQRICGHKKVSLCNDGNCAALAEMKNGSLKGVQNGAVITIGTGIGGAIISDYKIHEGAFLNAGEFSFLPYRDGYVWQYLKTAQLLEIYNKKTNRPVDNGMEFFARYAEDAFAQAALNEYVDRFMPLLQMLVCMVDPQVIVIGGGISKQPVLIECFKQRIQHYKPQFNLTHLQIKACHYHNEANLLGAYYFYQTH